MGNPFYPQVMYSEASSELQALYDDIMSTFEMGYVLNYFKCQGSHPALLRANWEKIKGVMFNGSLPRLFKEEVIYRISQNRKCEYCAFVHAKIVDDLKLKINQMQGHTTFSTFTPNQQQAIALLVQFSSVPQDSTPDLRALIDCGFTPAQIPELLALVDLTIMMNVQATLSGIEIDEEMLPSSSLS